MDALVRAVERGGFAPAARELGVTPSALSKVVSKLERRLGVRLLHRSTRKLKPTAEGEAYLARAVKILEAVAEADNEAIRHAGQPSGRLRMHAGTSFGTYALVPALPDFLDRYPAIELDLRMGDRPNDPAEVGADLIIRLGPPPDAALVARPIARHPARHLRLPGLHRATRRAGRSGGARAAPVPHHRRCARSRALALPRGRTPLRHRGARPRHREQRRDAGRTRAARAGHRPPAGPDRRSLARGRPARAAARRPARRRAGDRARDPSLRARAPAEGRGDGRLPRRALRQRALAVVRNAVRRRRPARRDRASGRAGPAAADDGIVMPRGYPRPMRALRYDHYGDPVGRRPRRGRAAAPGGRRTAGARRARRPQSARREAGRRPPPAACPAWRGRRAASASTSPAPSSGVGGGDMHGRFPRATRVRDALAVQAARQLRRALRDRRGAARPPCPTASTTRPPPRCRSRPAPPCRRWSTTRGSSPGSA